MICPESKFKKFWDLFINLVLLIFCFKAPFDVVFIDNPSLISQSVDWSMDFIFLVDVIIQFNIAYFDEKEMKLIKDRKKIAKNYI